ncbi:MAG: hypothetical protein IPP34_21485 [Bacteroidetes bacterium]|nr:hypothetical protein [Bacteroidota bacterium]
MKGKMLEVTERSSKVTGTALLLPKIFVNNGMPGKEKGRDEAVGNLQCAMTSSQCKMQNVQRPIQIVKFSLKGKMS